MKKTLKNKHLGFTVFSHISFIIFSLCCIVPFLLLIAISFSNEKDILDGGFALIPERFSLDAYKYVLTEPSSLIDAYGITIFYTIFGTIVSVVFMAGMAYTLARKTFRYKKALTIFLLITMLFNGGLTSSYIINTQIYRLGDTLWIYIFNSSTVTAYTVFVFRTFFKQIPESLIESANLEGANEWQLLTKIIIPLSKPVLATFGFMGAVSRWNDLQVALYYISNSKLYTLQLLLQNILNQAEYLKELQKVMDVSAISMNTIPTETMKFAMCILACGPMILTFPFFQKYLTKGMVVGAVKG
ncbi:MAG: carbohydrate ABC transporter permease [Clostridia bacterium]|nr:carbohydrate ABC transporter permease [Clostridia bacterium]